MTIKDAEYEEDKDAFPHDAYTIKGWGKGIAFRVLGWEREMDRFAEMEQVGRTGLVAVHMVGDNKVYFEQVSNLVPLKDEDYCQNCGQVGCGHTNV
jgi:hypothetical protein